MPESRSITVPAFPTLAGAAVVAAEPLTWPQTSAPRPRLQSVTASPTKHSSSTLRVLVVEDDPPVRNACAEIAATLGYAVETADSVPAARHALRRHPVDILLLDLKLPGGGGLGLLQEVQQTQPRISAIVMTAFASVSSAVESMRTGAGDYLAKPFSLEELSSVLERAAERRLAFDESRALRDRLRSGKPSGLLVSQDPAMDKLLRIVSKVAYTSHPVLIVGESGTGKESVARAIHSNGPLASGPFVPVDCGSLVPSLIEAELFGYSEGALPGFARAKTGLLATADGGTVFLDEIGDLPLPLQARLVRALNDRQLRPAGAVEPVPLRARILASTNHDLESMVETGRFRKDLFYRLNVVNIHIPPLRERKDDIPLLGAQILDRIGRERGIGYSFADDALRLMVEYSWPGNVRELEHALERACALSSGPLVHASDLPTQLQEYRYQRREFESIPVGPESADVIPIFELERQAILKTLRQLNGDKLQAARLLGIGKTTLYRKLKEYGFSDDLD